MQQNPAVPALVFPHTQPPEPGTLCEVAPGVRWFRLPLPYRLDHVNVYLIEDADGRAAPYFDDRDPLSPRPRRARRLARRTFWTAALHAASGISLQPRAAIC